MTDKAKHFKIHTLLNTPKGALLQLLSPYHLERHRKSIRWLPGFLPRLPTLAPKLCISLSVLISLGFFLPRSIAMMTTVCLLGIGVAATVVAGTPGTGTAVWRSSRSGRDLASGQSDMASAGSLLGRSIQVLWV